MSAEEHPLSGSFDDASLLPHPDERLDEVNDRLRLLQKKAGMTFGTDALLLASFVRPRPGGTGVELGAGSGIVSLLCACRAGFSHIECVEVQPEYADLCRRNVRLNGLDGVITVKEADLRDETAFDGREADAVFANPPYMKTVSGFASADPGRNAARHEVWGGIDDFCRTAARRLRFGGTFSVVWRPDRMTDLFCALRQCGLEPKKAVFVSSRTGAAPSLLLIESRKGGAHGGLRTASFSICDAEGRNTPQMQTVLCGGRFPL